MIKLGLRAAYPIQEEEYYKMDLLNFVSSILDKLKKSNLLNSSDILLEAEPNLYIKKIDEELFNFIQFSEKKAKILISKLLKYATAISIFNSRTVSSSLASLNNNQVITLKNTNFIQQELNIWSSENANLIRSIPRNIAESLTISIYSLLRDKKSISKSKEDLSKIAKASINRAKLIATDQVSKLHGTLTKYRHLEAGITTYKWSSKKDKKVRDTHLVLENLICSWNDPTVYKTNHKNTRWDSKITISAVTKHPSEDFQCRCVAIPVIY
jgi:SPP1 gp7 family putative phage head morphogenesis protein